MRSVLMSLSPYYYYLIAVGKKTTEFRKKIPHASDWDKRIHCYMSRDEKSFALIPKERQEEMRKHFGKVGLQFEVSGAFSIGWMNMDYPIPAYEGDKTMCVVGEGYNVTVGELESSCLSYEELEKYGKKKTVYGLCASNVKVEKPVPISLYLTQQDTGGVSGNHYILTPPQSW